MIFTGSAFAIVCARTASNATYLAGIGPNDQSKMGPSTETAATPNSRSLCGTHDLRGVPMTNPNLSAIRWIDLDASLASLCSWCRHSEFIHSESGPCLFSECTCPRFFPVVESAPHGESAGESAT